MQGKTAWSLMAGIERQQTQNIKFSVKNGSQCLMQGKTAWSLMAGIDRQQTQNIKFSVKNGG